MRGIDSDTELGASALSFSECGWKLIDEKGTGKHFLLSYFVSLVLEVNPGALCMPYLSAASLGPHSLIYLVLFKQWSMEHLFLGN